jgi:hypothetical protein
MKSVKTRARHKVCAILARVHFIQPLKDRIVREGGYGLALEGASAEPGQLQLITQSYRRVLSTGTWAHTQRRVSLRKLGLCSPRASPAVFSRKRQKKESKILQNEATKSNRISKSASKTGQNEAKRSETLSG